MIYTQIVFVELKTRGPLTRATLADVCNLDTRTVERTLQRLISLGKVEAIKVRSRLHGYVYAASEGATMPGDGRGRPRKGAA